MFKKDLFTHEPNTKLGQYKMSQNQLAPTVLAAIIEFERPDLVVEIGTQHGGLTCALKELTRVPYDLITYDVCDLRDEEAIKSFYFLGIEFRNKDCFDGSLEKLIKERSDEKIMILCDGGNKNKEFKTFAPLLRENDVIMTHDSLRGIKDDRKDDWARFWMADEFSYKMDDEELIHWRNPWWYWLASKAAWYGVKRV